MNAMFAEQQLNDVLDLHEKSFALLKWVRAALRNGQISFSVVHHTTDSADAAAEWIARHRQNIPANARPEANQLVTFSKLFVSFLMTSFRLNANGMRLVSDCGCRCEYCSFLQASPNLEVRVPSGKDIKTARELKRIYLAGIAEEQNCSHSSLMLTNLFAQREFAVEISLATWGNELLRRSQYASQGEAVLALWRDFAWRNGVPISKFKITAEKILTAERHILTALQANL